MSTPVLPPYNAPFLPVPQITPFTYRDGTTMLKKLEHMVKYINKELVPFVNENYSELAEEFQNQVNILIAQVNAALASQTEDVEQKIADLETYVNNAVDSIINSSIQVQDSVIAGAIEDENSQTRAALDTRITEIGDATYLKTADAEDTIYQYGDPKYLQIANVGTAVNDELSNPASPSNNTVEGIVQTVGDARYVQSTDLDADVAAYVEDTNSDTYTAINDLFQERDTTFSLSEATLDYGMRMGPSSSTRVAQAVFISHALNGQVFYTQATPGTVGGRETTLVVRCSSFGNVIGEMALVDAGHGTGLAVEVDGSGNVWIWSSFINQAIPSGNGRYNVVRVPWQSGASLVWANVSAYVVAQISGTAYTTIHYDEWNHIMGVRADNGFGTGANFSAHFIEKLKANIWEPINTCTHTYAAGMALQGWAYLEGYWYLLSGSRNDEVTPIPATITRFNASTGVTDYVKNIDAVRNGPTGVQLFSEPEGMSIGRGPRGEASIVVGVSVGPTSGRSNNLWCVNMGGVLPFRSQNYMKDFQFDGSKWTPLLFTPAAGYTLGSATQAFEVRVAGGYLELRGTIDGSYPPGSVTVGQLTAGAYSTVRHIRAVAAKNSSSVSPSTNCRVDINTSGAVSVSTDLNGTGAGTWVDFTGIRVPLF